MANLRHVTLLALASCARPPEPESPISAPERVRTCYPLHLGGQVCDDVATSVLCERDSDGVQWLRWFSKDKRGRWKQHRERARNCWTDGR